MRVAKLVDQKREEYGAETIVRGSDYPDMERIPSGIFALDLATGGGFPRRRISVIYGPEGSGKSNLALLALAMHQRLYPDLTCVYIDLENAFDPVWAARMGVDVDRLFIVRPSHAEQAAQTLDEMLDADDIGMIVFDSLAVMTPAAVLEKDATQKTMGGNAQVIGEMVKKTLQGLMDAEKAGRAPTIIFINQIRHKVGVVYGDPEHMPGGFAPKHAATLSIRLYSKPIMDNAISKVMPVARETTFVLKKARLHALAADGKYVLITLAHDGFNVGQCDEWNTVLHYLKTAGWVVQGKGGWTLTTNGVSNTYKTLAEIKAALDSDAVGLAKLKSALIQHFREQQVVKSAD